METLIVVTTAVIFAGIVYLVYSQSKKKVKTYKPGTGSTPEIPREQ